MIRIGLKSLLLALAVMGLITFAGVQHLFDIRRVLSLQPEVLWLIGCLAGFASLGASYFLRSRKESAYHLAVGWKEHRTAGSLTLLSVKERGLWIGARDGLPAYEFGRFTFPALTAFGLLIFGLVILENRSLMLLEHFYHNMTKDYGHICPREGDEPEVVKPPKMGCELVKKAFALGYTKDLGDCAEDEAEKDEKVCDHRQFDEPASHYSYRLISRFVKTLVDHTRSLPSNLDKAALVKEAGTWPDLVDHQSQGFLGVPRQAVHIFTDLPEPGGILAKARRRLHPNHCQDELRELRFRMSQKGEDPGAQLEDTLGHLLFSPAVGRDSTYCRPYIIHWAAAADTCQVLAEKGAAALPTYGLAQSIAAVVKRQRLAEAFPRAEAPSKEKAAKPAETDKPLAVDIDKPQVGEVAPPPPAKPARPLVSFHCLMTTGPAEPLHASLADEDELNFPIEAVTLPKPGSDGLFPTHELFARVAQVFVPDFQYNNLDRPMPLPLSEERFRSEIGRSGDALKLSKYELLRSSDVLAGDVWVYSYPSYLEVYPWQPHMANFVKRFRRAFLQKENKP